ncbi:MAG: hypothetical protein LCH57_01750 [Proteobacteria bacterium]|nr:hypothetical protein [Pseudomonadota bacterium]
MNAAFDPIPDRHPRLVAWINFYRAAGVPIKVLAGYFNASVGELIEAGAEP